MCRVTPALTNMKITRVYGDNGQLLKVIKDGKVIIK